MKGTSESPSKDGGGRTQLSSKYRKDLGGFSLLIKNCTPIKEEGHEDTPRSRKNKKDYSGDE